MGLSLYGFPSINLCALFCMVVLVYHSVILFICFCYEIEMKYQWSSLAYENLTWYQSHPERRHYVATEAMDSYFLILSPQSIDKRRLG